MNREHERTLGGLWTGGFLAAQKVFGLPHLLPPLFVDRVDDVTPVVRELKRWLDKHKPDAILSGVPSTVAALKKLKLRIPQDIAVAATSTYDMELGAGINQNSEVIGRVAAETLIALINSNDRGNPSLPRLILVEGTWVDGLSLPNLKAG